MSDNYINSTEHTDQENNDLVSRSIYLLTEHFANRLERDLKDAIDCDFPIVIRELLDEIQLIEALIKFRGPQPAEPAPEDPKAKIKVLRN